MTHDFSVHAIDPEDKGFAPAVYHLGGHDELDKILASMAKVYPGKIKFNSVSNYD